MGKAKTQPIRFVGKCIYCGASDAPLTDEHILAANLGCSRVLQKASCEACQKIINEEIETPCLRLMFRDIRYRKNIGSRRVKGRPKTLPLYSIDSKNAPGSGERLDLSGWSFKEVPYTEHLTILMLPIITQAGYLLFLTPDQARSNVNLIPWYRIENPEIEHDRRKTIAAETKFHATIFARLLAKTAHCSMVAQYGVDTFKPYLLDIILGKDVSKCWWYIGGSPFIPTATNQPYEISNGMIDIGVHAADLICDVRIFANLGAPGYRLVVGKKF